MMELIIWTNVRNIYTFAIENVYHIVSVLLFFSFPVRPAGRTHEELLWKVLVLNISQTTVLYNPCDTRVTHISVLDLLPCGEGGAGQKNASWELVWDFKLEVLK